MPNAIRAIIVEPGKQPRVAEVEDVLENWQKLVGGYVQDVGLSDGSRLLCDEDAKRKRDPPPFNRYVEGHAILGTFVIIRQQGTKFSSVEDDDTKRWLRP